MSIYTRQPGRHGTRKQYQQGRCRCSRCRKANADYMQKLRVDRLRGKLPKHMRVPAAGTWKRLRAMVPEFGGRKALALRLGIRKGQLRFGRQTMHLCSVLLVNALYDSMMPEDLDAVGHELEGLR